MKCSLAPQVKAALARFSFGTESETASVPSAIFWIDPVPPPFGPSRVKVTPLLSLAIRMSEKRSTPCQPGSGSSTRKLPYSSCQLACAEPNAAAT